jgi:uracil-DNA glycosylase family 4
METQDGNMPKLVKKPKISLDPYQPESLSSASVERLWCLKCKLFQGCRTPFMKPYVPHNWSGLLLAVGEASGQDEDEHSGEPFTGRAGQLLSKLLRQAGYHDEDVALVNAVRCRPPGNRTPHLPELRACRPFLIRVIERLGPRYIICLGLAAAKSVTNSGDITVRGSRGRLYPVLAGSPRVPIAHASITYHPAAVLHGKPELEPVILDDLRWPFKPQLERPSWGIPQTTTVAIDTEWGPDNQLLTTGLANTEVAWAEETTCDTPVIPSRLQQVTRLVTHSGAEDLDHLLAGNLTPQLNSKLVQGFNWIDSLLITRMVDENLPSYKLEDLLLSTFRVDEWKSETQDSWDGDASLWNSVQRTERCALDSWATAVLVKKLIHDSPGIINHPLTELTHRQAMALHRIRLSGAMISQEKLSQLLSQLRQESEKWSSLTIQQATALGARLDFRPTNDNHIRELLYETLGLAVTERSDTGLPSVDKDTLNAMGNRLPEGKEQEFLSVLTEANRWSKALDYAEQLETYSFPSGARSDTVDLRFLPFRINPLGAKTGRRSSSEPNSQNLAEPLRHVFVSRWPGGKIGNFDYSGLEVVLIAWEAQDHRLLEAFTVGRKYVDVAKWLLGLDVVEGDKNYKLAKSCVLSLNYCKTAGSFGKDLIRKFGIQLNPDIRQHYREAARIHERYFRTFPRLRAYMETREEELLRTNQVVSKIGRIRHLPVPDGQNTLGFEHARNQAVNFPIQSLASDVTGCALLDIETELCHVSGVDLLQRHLALREWYCRNLLTTGGKHEIIFPEVGSTIINEVHDSLVGDLHPDHLKRDTELFVETMRASKTFRQLVPDFTPTLKVGVILDDFWRSK